MDSSSQDSHCESLSAVLVAHAGVSKGELTDCLDGLASQTLDESHLEVILVVDDAPDLTTWVVDAYEADDLVTVYSREVDRGLADARNYGAEKATGDIVAFLDTDARPVSRWAEMMVRAFHREQTLGVSGSADPYWITESERRPSWLPPEFDWLVGVTSPPAVPNTATPIRNGFGCNIAFCRDVFHEVGGFDPELGKSQRSLLQGEETEFCIRLHEWADVEEPFWHEPAARIEHQVREDQIRPGYLIKRAFRQGQTKHRISKEHSRESVGQESVFLHHLLRRSIPNYLRDGVIKPSHTSLLQCFMICGLVLAVGGGFLYSLLGAHPLPPNF